MKNMRKLTALLLAVVMVLSLSIAAFARDGGTISGAKINNESATIVTIDGVTYVRATLAGTNSFTKSEYSLRNATIAFTASAAPTATGVTFTAGANNTYTATGVDLFNKCCDVTVDGTLYRFAAGLKSGIVVIDDNDPWKVTFSCGSTTFTNKAVNVQNPNIGNSGYADGWTGIAYTASADLKDEVDDITSLDLTITKTNANATISGEYVTANSDGTYNVKLFVEDPEDDTKNKADKVVRVTYNGEHRDYYLAVTDGSDITVSIRFNTEHATDTTKAEALQEKMRNASEGNTGTLYVTLDESKTVMDALLAASDEAGFVVDYTNSSYGAYVTGIGGLTAGGSAGWMYKVNGVMPMTGAGNYTLQNGDTIVWGYVSSFSDSFD